mmetsp:Transcript_29474/g.59204  ORF Transcript_29474/g.59204 Transcript_29474/m.59204 type:complete len:123 (+) Transcript_29474:726-1094(+)
MVSSSRTPLSAFLLKVLLLFFNLQDMTFYGWLGFLHPKPLKTWLLRRALGGQTTSGSLLPFLWRMLVYKTADLSYKKNAYLYELGGYMPPSALSPPLYKYKAQGLGYMQKKFKEKTTDVHKK